MENPGSYITTMNRTRLFSTTTFLLTKYKFIGQAIINCRTDHTFPVQTANVRFNLMYIDQILPRIVELL